MRPVLPRPDGWVVTTQRGTEDPQPHGRMPLFLVELQAPGSGIEQVERMHAALEHAVSRRVATGAAIGWVGGLVVPSDRRCLCLVQAAEEHEVRLARDTAGLHAAGIRPVHLVSDPEHRDRCTARDDENRPPRKGSS